MVKWTIAYAIVCMIYVYLFQYKRKKTWLASFLLIFWFPLFGFFINYFMYRHFKSNKPLKTGDFPQMDTEEGAVVSFIKEDVNVERNVIPIEDALILNENKVKRRVLLNLLKEESIQNMEALKFALENDDSETSHYAATAIMEIKRKLLQSMQELEAHLNENPNDIQILSSYREVIKQYINSGFLDEKTHRKNKYLYSSVLEKMIEIEPNEANYFIEKITSDLSLAEYQKARDFCDLFLSLHPFCEEAYFLDMQINYSIRDLHAFSNSIDRLRNSNVRLSPNGLSRLRFWLQGEWNE